MEPAYECSLTLAGLGQLSVMSRSRDSASVGMQCNAPNTWSPIERYAMVPPLDFPSRHAHPPTLAAWPFAAKGHSPFLAGDLAGLGYHLTSTCKIIGCDSGNFGQEMSHKD